MATLHGKKLTAKQHAALKKKWASEDKKFFRERYRADIKRLQDQLKSWQKRAMETKKKRGSALGIQLNAISSRKAEIKALQTKIKQLKS